jgi:cellulose synthase/poly-beta-1,6-N-acetylglucosamine synthase-like glycosyltransferase
MQYFISQMIFWLDVIILIYFIVLNSFYILLVALSLPDIVQRFRETNQERFERLLKSESVPPITILAPAYNEEEGILPSVRSMLNLSYPHVEVVVINDGSKDGTMAKLIREFNLIEVPPAIQVTILTQPIKSFYRSRDYPNLKVLDKVNGGKADSLNAGINACSTPFFMAVDADTIIDRDALRRMIRPMLTRKHTIASGSTIRVANDCKVEYGRVIEVNYPRKILPAIQVVEYLRAFLFGRLGWNHLGGNLVISGAFGLFDRAAVLAVGGYLTDTVGEDMELTVRLHRYFRDQKLPYRVQFIPDPVAWTEVPADFQSLAKQRERWHRGLIDTLSRHRDMFLNPKYGMVGMLSFPVFVIGEMMAPVVEFVGYIGLVFGLIFHAVNLPFAILFFMAAWGLMIILTIFSIIMEETTFRKYTKFTDLLKMFMYSLLENIGYRQVTVFWRLKGFWNYFRGVKNWNKTKRVGFNTVR